MSTTKSTSKTVGKGGSQRVRGQRWMDEHVADPFVLQAKKDGYRSRAAYKILELDQRDRLFRAGAVVVDLGAAPGSWSQVAATRVGATGRVVAVDLLPVDPIVNVTILRGDITTDPVIAQMDAALGGLAVDLVLSDMAPNISGIAPGRSGGTRNRAILALAQARGGAGGQDVPGRRV